MLQWQTWQRPGGSRASLQHAVEDGHARCGIELPRLKDRWPVTRQPGRTCQNCWYTFPLEERKKLRAEAEEAERQGG